MFKPIIGVFLPNDTSPPHSKVISWVTFYHATLTYIKRGKLTFPLLLMLFWQHWFSPNKHSLIHSSTTTQRCTIHNFCYPHADGRNHREKTDLYTSFAAWVAPYSKVYRSMTLKCGHLPILIEVRHAESTRTLVYYTMNRPGIPFEEADFLVGKWQKWARSLTFGDILLLSMHPVSPYS